MLQHLRRTSPAAVALAVLRSLFAATLVLAAAGDLDTTFSGDGLQSFEFGSGWVDNAWAMALQSDGKIVLAGSTDGGVGAADFAVARLDTSGVPDPLFDTDGLQVTDVGASGFVAGVAIQPSDGKIVVAGPNADNLLTIVRYDTSGAPDSSFDTDGIVQLPGGGIGADVAVQSDGKIVATTAIMNLSGDLDFIVYRLNSDGSPDLTFNLTGSKQFGFGAGKDDTPHSLLIQGAKIVIGGETCSASVCDFALARLKSTGKLDPKFSSDGRTTTNFGVSEKLNDLALQPNNMIVAVGSAASSTTNSFAVARYKTSGGLDTYFRSTGKKLYSVGVNGSAQAVAIQPDGKIVVSGYADNGTDSDFAVIRLKAKGALDTAFSGDGKLLIDFATSFDAAYTMALDTAGNIVLGGYTNSGTNDFAAARVLP